MENKLSEASVIKALECCNETKASECSECPLLSVECSKYDLYKLALDLINRQKAEIERLQKLQKPTGAGGYKIENGKVIFYSDMLNGYRHEYKDLEEIVKELNLYMHTDYKNIELISHYKHKAQTAKSEGRKEFAERLKTLLYMPDNRVVRRTVYTDEIDNLVKEMAGE